MPVRTRPHGVSIVTCSHNGAARLPATLDHLARQVVPADVGWEVVIVDNDSSDATRDVAQSACRRQAPRRWFVVHERELGLTPARVRGIREASYEFIAFVDDDNWVATDWVEKAFRLMSEAPDVGACGGVNEGVFDSEPPPWFDSAKGRYAIGDHGVSARDLNGTGAVPWGAGLVMRHEAWAALVAAGFRPTLSDRRGTSLVGGGDIEICMALAAAGWRLRYDPRLRLRHYMPPERLRWEYYLRLLRAQGSSGTALDAYDATFHEGRHPARLWLGQRWAYQAARAIVELMRVHPVDALTPTAFLTEGARHADFVVTRRARVWALLKERSAYSRRFAAFSRWAKQATADGPGGPPDP